MTNDNGITITTKIDTDCEVCEYREDSFCELFYEELKFIDTPNELTIYRCEECIKRIRVYPYE